MAAQAHVWLRPQPGTDGALLAELKAQIEKVKDTPADAADGVQKKDAVQTAARLLVENGPAMIVYGSGITHYATGPDTLRALQALAATLTPVAELLPLVGASNTMGVLASGLAAAAGSRNYTDIVASITAGEVKALYLAGEMPPLEALEKLDFLVVQDLLLSDDLRQYTDVFLPAATFVEMSGTLTNLEGRAQHFAAAIPQQGEARPDWLIAAQIAQLMGAGGFAHENSAAVLKEMQGLEPQTRPAMMPAKPPVITPADSVYPVTLILERNQYAYRGAMLTEQVKGMELVKADEDRLVLHPEDAARINVGDGDLVRLISAHGADTLVAQVSAKVLPGAPFASINALNGSAIFAAGLPDLKACAVRLEKVEEAN
jgi:predicted molibdopterin-dependent oxidoreductase YjgC